MLRVPIGYAQAGMVLAMPIFHPRRQDTMLLKAGMELDARTVERLTELKIKEFWIRYPGFEFVGEYICPQVQESHGVVTRHIGEAIDQVSSGTHARLNYSEYKLAIAGLLQSLVANPKASLFVQEMADQAEPALRHSSSVCMISVLMGLKLEEYLIDQRSRMHIRGAKDVAKLGLGAMLHDIGMLRLSAAAMERWNRTQDESDVEFQQHVVIGFKMIREAVGPAGAAAVLHHHQKFDGSGFPRRKLLDGSFVSLAGQDIHVYARIIAAADIFDRLRHPPGQAPEQPTLPVVRVLRLMQTLPYVNWVDPIVFRAMLSVVPAYAPGSMVMLSTGERAVVGETFPSDPCRPVVHVIGDPRSGFDKPAAECRRYDLRSEPEISVVEAEGQNVTDDNFALSPDVAVEMAIAHAAAMTKLSAA
jgi:HD-GYP domain-containing protein (c-di-GMP phosphodiesterase class II)